MYPNCVCVGSVILHAKSMHLIVLSSVTCTFLASFSTLRHKQLDFWKKCIEHKENPIKLQVFLRLLLISKIFDSVCNMGYTVAFINPLLIKCVDHIHITGQQTCGT